MKRTSRQKQHHPDLLCYAPGSGLGHLTRAISVLRRWNTATRRTSLLLTYSPFAHLAGREGVAVRQIAGPDADAVKRTVSEAQPKLLLVDTFARGVAGELTDLLPTLKIPVVLVQRYLNPAYLRQFNVAALVVQYYRLVVRIADALPPQTLSQRTLDIPPVVLRHARELPPAPRHGWLFVDWGHGSEPYLQVARHVAAQRGKELRVARAPDDWPAMLLMPAAELLIASGGYNVFHEAALTGTPAIFVPMRRMYDDQFGRTAAAPHARSPEMLRTMLLAPPPVPLPPITGEGATEAVAAILRLLPHGHAAEAAKPPKAAATGKEKRPARKPARKPAKKTARKGAKKPVKKAPKKAAKKAAARAARRKPQPRSAARRSAPRRAPAPRKTKRPRAATRKIRPVPRPRKAPKKKTRARSRR